MATQTTTTSEKFSLNWKDAGKGLLIAVLTAALTAMLSAMQIGGLNIDWKAIGIIALTAGVSYLVKNFFTASEIVITDPTPAQIQGIKSGGEATVIVTQPNNPS